MNIKQLKRVVTILDEVDAVQSHLEHCGEYHPAIRDALVGSMVQLRASIIDRVKEEHSLEIEV